MKRGILLVSLILVLFASAEGATIYVPADYDTIQNAVNAAQAGDTVLIAPGTYSGLHYPPVSDTTRCVVFMKEDIVLLGSGQGATIIDALNQGRGVYCDSVANARIEGMTITHAYSAVYGSGIFCKNHSSPGIFDVEVTDCGDGGIICLNGSSPEIRSCSITGNDSKQGGGVAIEVNSDPHLVSCTIRDNSAPEGGGIFVRAGAAPIVDSCVVDSNFLNTLNGIGGGVGVRNAHMTMRHCQVNGNVSTGSGGGLSLLDNANVLIEDTRIEGNSTTASYGPGGGIYGEFARMELVRCTIANNSAPGSSSDGGGIYSTFDTTMIHSCTIAENGTNEPNGTGGGIYYLAGEHSLENTIIAFNSPGKGMSCVMATPDVRCSDLYGNQDGDGICGNDKGGNFSLDPLFCDLKENDYSLHCSSPCHENNHPTSEPCGRVGAHGLGGCNIVAVEEADGEELARPGSEMYATPNPFSPSTTIHFSLQRPARVSLSVYSLSGRRVRLLEEGSLGTGEYQVVWDGRSDAGRHLPSGVYFYRLEGTSPSRTGRLLLAR